MRVLLLQAEIKSAEKKLCFSTLRLKYQLIRQIE